MEYLTLVQIHYTLEEVEDGICESSLGRMPESKK
jgi:hypothetical protein